MNKRLTLPVHSITTRSVEIHAKLSSSELEQFVGAREAFLLLEGLVAPRDSAGFCVYVGEQVPEWHVGDVNVMAGAGTKGVGVVLELSTGIRVRFGRTFSFTLTPAGTSRRSPITIARARLSANGPFVTWAGYRSRVPAFVRELHTKELAALGYDRSGRAVRREVGGRRIEFKFDEDLDTPRPAAPLILPLVVTMSVTERDGTRNERRLDETLAIGAGVDPALLRESAVRLVEAASKAIARKGSR